MYRVEAHDPRNARFAELLAIALNRLYPDPPIHLEGVFIGLDSADPSGSRSVTLYHQLSLEEPDTVLEQACLDTELE